MNEVVVRKEKMRKLSPIWKVGFVVPSFIIGTVMTFTAWAGYAAVCFILSSCTPERPNGPNLVTVDNPHYGKSPRNYKNGAGRNMGGHKKFHGYQTN